MRRKILVAILLNVLVISVTLGIISNLIVNESIKRSLHDRITLSSIIADYIEMLLQGNLNRLYDISLSGKIDLTDGDWEPEKKALETAYRYSLFSDGVFLLDRYGNELLTYPSRTASAGNLTYINYVNQVLQTGKPVISNIYTIEPIKKQVIFIMTPLRNKDGGIVGIAGGMLSPTNPFMNQLLQTIKLEQNSYIEIVDYNEIVVASDNPSHVLRHHNHDRALGRMIREAQPGIRECRHGFSHPKSEAATLDILAFVPLKIAPWGVVVGQAEHDIFAPSKKLQKIFLVLILTFTGTSLVFAMGVSKGIVRPLKSLIDETNRIADGDLSHPVSGMGSDEILQLSKSFETMRRELAASLERIQRQNVELEHRVAMRTIQIQQSRQKVESLLKKVISSQEEERKRIARELHDEILQDISACLINLEICKLSPEKINVQKIDEMREIVTKSIDNIHTVIQNLRPSMLDDLGLDAAITWLLNKNLKSRGITYFLTINHPSVKRHPPQVEILLFRIIQESITNIARHAGAQNVFVCLRSDGKVAKVEIEDDGEGFDTQEVLRYVAENGRGLGLLGMKERAALLDGRLLICSAPGQGTRISVTVPVPLTEDELEDEHV